MPQPSLPHGSPQAAVEYTFSQLRCNQEEAERLSQAWQRHARAHQRASWAVVGALGVAMIIDVVPLNGDSHQLVWAPIAVAFGCAAEAQRRGSEISRVNLAEKQNVLQGNALRAALAYNIIVGAGDKLGESGQAMLQIGIAQVPEAQRPELLYGYAPAPDGQGPAELGPAPE